MTNEEAIEKLREISDDYWDDDGYGGVTRSYVDGITAIDMAIEALQERKTGKWIRKDSHTTFKCSACGNFLNFHGVNAGRGDANYCPNCGAKMEVDE